MSNILQIMTYGEQLKDPRWQRKRLEILERDKFACKICGDIKNQLHVHHGGYISGLKIWEYHNWALHTLCKNCHINISSNIQSFNYALSIMTQSEENYDILKELVEIISAISSDDKTNLFKYIKSIPY